MDLHANADPGLLRHPGGQPAGRPPVRAPLSRTQVRRLPRRDHGGRPPTWARVARARAFAQKLDMPLAIVDKRRQKANSSEVMNIIGDVRGQDTSSCWTTWWTPAGSLCNAAKALVEIGGAKDVYGLRHPRRALRPGHRAHRGERASTSSFFLDTIPAVRGRQAVHKIKYVNVAARVRRGHQPHLSTRLPSPRCSSDSDLPARPDLIPTSNAPRGTACAVPLSPCSARRFFSHDRQCSSAGEASRPPPWTGFWSAWATPGTSTRTPATTWAF